jgi:hypothetical protein
VVTLCLPSQFLVERTGVDKSTVAVVEPGLNFVVEPVRDRAAERVGENRKYDSSDYESHGDPYHLCDVFITGIVHEMFSDHFLHCVSPFRRSLYTTAIWLFAVNTAEIGDS